MKRFFRAVRPFLLPALTVAFLLFLFSNSAQSAGHSAGRSNPLAVFLARWLEKIFSVPVSVRACSYVIRKLAHMGEFVIFSALLSLSVAQRRKALFPARFEIWLCGLFVGLTDEFIQTLFVGRSPEVSDVMIDFAGVLTGYFLISLFFRLKRRRKNLSAEKGNGSRGEEKRRH